MANLTFVGGNSDGGEFDDSRRSFLLTYSQADLEKFPTCVQFSQCVLSGIENSSTSKKNVTDWACAKEDHADGGKHYHMSLQFDGTRRWKPIWRYIYKEHGISVDFALENCGYVAAYRYICKNKSKDEVLHSVGHANLDEIKSPKTKKAMQRQNDKVKQRRSEGSQSDSSLSAGTSTTKPAKKKRLDICDVADYLVENNIRTEAALMKEALSRSQRGENDLRRFVLSRTPKARADLIADTWKMQDSPKTLERSNMSRMSLIRQSFEGRCSDDCAGEWLKCAKEVLKNNRINIFNFAFAIRQSLTKGRQKHVNILMVGPTNCGKSFLLNPLEIIFKAFVNPATGKYAWVGLDECEVAYLNDFRWNPETIAWSDFLLLLEGQTVHLPRPKNQFATDMRISRENTIPLFATSKGPIEYVGKFNSRDDRETDMMTSRWNKFELYEQIPKEKAKHMEPCPRCFSELVLQGADED